MIKIHKNKSISEFTTFGVPVKAKYFAEFFNLEELKNIFIEQKFREEEKLILGGGSNLLFTKDFSGIVLKNSIKGISILKEEEENVWMKVGAGENWHEFVLHCVDNGLGGIENLSLIPGSIGASPMQNIGAYGVEIKDVFYELEAYHIETGEIHVFNNQECEFGYRESVFKKKFKNEYVILSVTYKLSKKPILNISYGAIESELVNMGVSTLSIKAISDAVINIRTRKLPNPKEIGNAGSFFKNPIISKTEFEELKKKYPKVAFYPLPEEKYKIAAGWMIDQLGWKGKTLNGYGVHKNQALVLVNYGKSKGKDIFNLSAEIMDSVYNSFGINLEREVNIY